MKPKCSLILACAVWVWVLPGCPTTRPSPPVTIQQYESLQRDDPQLYTRSTIVQYNVSRALDPSLSDADRMASMRLIKRVGGLEPGVHDQLAGILDESDAPEPLTSEVLEYLLEHDYPGLGPHAVGMLGKLEGKPQLRDAVLDWLYKNPSEGVLAEVVKLWAREESTTSVNEPRYRSLVQRLTGLPWDTALIQNLNSPDFFARGSAMDVLADRIPQTLLLQRLGRLTPRTEAVESIQAFIDRFDYIPTNGSELVAVVTLYKTRAEMFPEAGRLNAEWEESYGYRFRIRDFHVISRLGRDPLRTALRRTQLVLEIGQALMGVDHAEYTADGQEDTRFWTQADTLGMADLWNIYLLSEMLARPRVQLAMKMMSERDRADRSHAWGGLVFYEGGQAEAKLYPPSDNAPANDRMYVPTRRAIIDGRDAMCRFAAHFSQANNTSRIGPTKEELADARVNEYYGLIFTSLGDEFAAHYYNPSGSVVSLGTYPFGQSGQ